MNEVIKQFEKDFYQSFVNESDKGGKTCAGISPNIRPKRRFRISFPHWPQTKHLYTHYIVEIINGYDSSIWYAVRHDNKIDEI